MMDRFGRFAMDTLSWAFTLLGRAAQDSAHHTTMMPAAEALLWTAGASTQCHCSTQVLLVTTSTTIRYLLSFFI